MAKTILITGASSGIGRACAERFQAAGWNVAATMRQPAQESALTQLANVAVLRLDVMDRDSIAAAVAETISRFGGIDVLLNNAGYGLAGPLEAVTPAQLERQFATNLYGPVYTMQACLPHFRARGAGLILNVSSIGGRLVLPFNSLYHGTKFALEGISEALGLELAPFGIQVKIIEPGGVKTDFAGRSLDFTRQEGLTAYDASLQGAITVFAGLTSSNQASEPHQTAEVIFGAATDGTDRVRYLAGEDAHNMARERAAKSDEEYRRWAVSFFQL
jgi:NAD(P)-dependent dehydrogenase (short-subunit alcohol dehydrogenase family)